MTLRLTKLDAGLPIVTAEGRPNQQLLRLINKAFAAIEAAFNGLEEAVENISVGQRRDAISASWTVPTLIATAADAGSDVTITIVDHTRYYGDESSAAVDGDALTGQAYSATVAVYYDDTEREGGAVSYQVTADLKSAQNNYVPGRHYVATLTTPAAAGPPTTGGSPPPGSGYSGSGGGGTVIP